MLNFLSCQWYSHSMVVFCMLMSTEAFSPPHIVFIMVDDLGWNDVSFHGSDQILTPNIDSLAYQGVILQQYYSEAICTPARTALLTGKYPMRLGMHGLPLLNSEDRGIPLTERLLPSYLKELGYATHLVGKWHVGMSKREYLPTSRGYDTHYGMRGGYIDYYTYNKVETLPDGRQLSGLDLFDDDVPQDMEQRYIIDALTDRAVKLIQQHNMSQPLFLHVTHNAPHSGNAGGALQPPLYVPIRNRHIADPNRRLFAEIVTHLDRSIGRIVRALANKQILDDTVIVFVSDNGAPTIGQLNNWGVNLPFRGLKYTPWEGGVRVPAFIYHSSFTPRVWNGLMHITDWLPTLTAAARGNFNTIIDGVDQWNSIVQGTESERKEVLIAIEDGRRNVYAAYRAGDYKIVVGNVSGLDNGYYGREFMVNKETPPSYYPMLRACEVAKVFESKGLHLEYGDVVAMRKATAIRQLETLSDQTPCEPSRTRACLFNVRRDPAERRDLWQQANKIAALLINRLRAFWTMQQRRGPPLLRSESNPANFHYVWWPWVNDTASDIFENFTESWNGYNVKVKHVKNNQSLNNDTTAALRVECDGTTGLRNFLCLLRSIF